jgi:hypothetical protein
MAARLLIYSGKLRGKTFALPPEGKVVIGRSKDAAITIPDANMSRAHCAITATSQGYRLEDLGSTNGTSVNGKRVREAVLREGDRIVFGETESEFRVKERFDDTETKMDLMPVGMPKEISPSEAIRAIQGGGPSDTAGSEPPPSEQVSERRRRVRFCDICDVTVPRSDVDSGAAREIAGRLVCSACLGRLETKNLDAVASLDLVLDALREELRREKGA